MAGEGSESTQWNHANPILEVSDVPRAIAYYRDVFGLIPSWMWENRIGGVHTDHSSIEIYLSRAQRPSSSRLAVFVDDADAALERYRAAGAEIVDEIKTQPWGLRGFTVRDPDGNLVDIAHEVAGGTIVQIHGQPNEGAAARAVDT
jgi:lactoylglutathione lyase